MWKTVNQIAKFKQPPEQPTSIRVNDKILTSDEMCNYFNSYFINMTKKLNLNRCQPLRHFDAPSDTVKMNFHEIASDMTIKYIDKLKNSSATSVDDIMIKSLKFVKFQIAEVLTHIINLS